MKKDQPIFDENGSFVAGKKGEKKKKPVDNSKDYMKIAMIGVPIVIVVIIIFVILFLLIRSSLEKSATDVTKSSTPTPEEIVLVENQTPTPTMTPTPIPAAPVQPVINVPTVTEDLAPSEGPEVTESVETIYVTVSPQHEAATSDSEQNTKQPTPSPVTNDYSYVPDILVSSYTDGLLTDGSVIEGIAVVNYINANPDMTFSVYNIYSNESITYVNGGASVEDIPVSATYKITKLQDSYAFTQVY